MDEKNTPPNGPGISKRDIWHKPVNCSGDRLLRMGCTQNRTLGTCSVVVIKSLLHSIVEFEN